MIYCVEDDISISDLILYTLKSVGMKATSFKNGDDLFTSLNKEIPDLILLDIMLPGEDGISILNRLKNDGRYADIPVIMATAKGTEFEKVSCLDAGADDYLVKPFGMMEMVSRIKAVLRRYQKKNETIIKVNDIEINTSERKVYIGDKLIQLTLKEYELLLLLMQNTKIVFSREELLNLVWGTSFVGASRTIDVHIGSLRNKLGDSGKYIKTIHGIGYLMEK